MYFLTTEKALHTFTFPSKFRGGYAALNQANNITWSKKRGGGGDQKCLLHKICP